MHNKQILEHIRHRPNFLTHIKLKPSKVGFPHPIRLYRKFSTFAQTVLNLNSYMPVFILTHIIK